MEGLMSRSGKKKSIFEFERPNIAGCCKQTFCFKFSSKAKHDIFSFFSGLLNGRRNSIFFKIAVEESDSMTFKNSTNTNN